MSSEVAQASSSAAFDHSLPSLDEDDSYYLHLYRTSSKRSARDLSECAPIILPSNTTSAEFAASASSSYAEAEVVARHIEFVSKELYHVVSRYPSKLSWPATSAHRILTSAIKAKSPLLQPSKSFSGTTFPCFRVHDELARVAELPMRRYLKQETWERRQATMREFLTPQRMALALRFVEYLEQPVAGSPNAGNHVKTIEGFYQLKEDSRSFVHFGDGLFVHVWRTASEARRLVSCAQKIWQTIFEHSLHPFGTLITAVMMIRGVAVTYTQLPPLLPLQHTLPFDTDPDTSASTAVTRALTALIGSSRHARGTEGGSLAHVVDPRLHVGADGRYYYMLPMAFGVFPEELDDPSSSSSTHTNATRTLPSPLRLEWYHALFSNGTSYRYTRSETIEKLRTTACVTAADAIVRESVPKLPDMMTQQIVAQTMHTLGVNMRFLYLVLEQVETLRARQGGQGAPTESFSVEQFQTTIEAINAEMICRTIKVLIRAELDAQMMGSDFVDQPTADNNNNSKKMTDMSAERVNRFMQLCSQRDNNNFWRDQVMVALREKFSCPSTFMIPYQSKYFKIVTWFLTIRFGAAYDVKTNRFTRLQQAPNPNSSFFAIPDTVKMQISAKKSDEAIRLLAMWWSAAEKLPSSTPTAWIERTFRMQRVATLAILMRHSARLRFIDECIKTIVQAQSSNTFVIPRMMAATFQLCMMDAVDPSRLVAHPLFLVVSQAVKDLTGSASSADDLWATADCNKEGTPASRIENSHYLGYTIRCLVVTSGDSASGGSIATSSSASSSPVMASPQSSDDALLTPQLRILLGIGAALQLRWNYFLMSKMNGTGNGQLEMRSAVGEEECSFFPIDVVMNSQLLRDTRFIRDVRVKAVLVVNLSRYSRVDNLLSLQQCTPMPEYIAAYHSVIKTFWEATVSQTSLPEVSFACVRSAAWWMAGTSGVGVPETNVTGIGVGWDDARKETSAALYNEPQVACAVVHCAAVYLQSSTLVGSAAAPLPTKAIEMLLDGDALLCEAYPTVINDKSAFAHTQDAFDLDVASTIHDVVGSTAFIGALSKCLAEALIPMHEWAVAKLVVNFLRECTRIQRTAAVNSAIQLFEEKSERAGVLQRFYRQIRSGGASLSFPVGSPEWRRMQAKKLDQLSLKASLYGVGMNIFAGFAFRRMEREELAARAQTTFWVIVLDEEVQFKKIISAKESLEQSRAFERLMEGECASRHAMQRMELDSFAEEAWKLWQEDHLNDVLLLQKSFVQETASQDFLSNEINLRHEVEVEELHIRLLEVEFAFHAEMCEMTLHSIADSAVGETEVLHCTTQQESHRWHIEVEELEASVDVLWRAWADGQLIEAGEHLVRNQSQGLQMYIHSDEATHREAIQVEATTFGIAALTVEWLRDEMAPELLRMWFTEYSALVISELVEPLFQTEFDAATAATRALHADVTWAVHGAAMTNLTTTETMERRDVALIEFASRCVLLEQLRQMRHAALVQEEASVWLQLTGENRFAQSITLPQHDARNALLMEENEAFMHLVLNAAQDGALTMQTEAWIEVERLFRNGMEYLHCGYKRRQQFTRPFILTPEHTTDVFAKEDAERRSVYLHAAVHYVRCLWHDSIRERFALLCEAEAAWRYQQIEVEQDAARAQIARHCSSTMFESLQSTLLAREDSLRRAIVVVDYRTQFAEWCVEWHRLHNRVNYCDQFLVECNKRLQEKEEYHRFATESRWSYGTAQLVAAFAIASRSAIESEWETAHRVTRRLWQLACKERNARTTLEDEERKARDQVAQLKALMESIRLNQFHATHKSLLCPSDRMLVGMRRRLDRQRRIAANRSVPRAAASGPIVASPSRDDCIIEVSPAETSPEVPEAMMVDLQRYRLDIIVEMEQTRRNHVEEYERSQFEIILRRAAASSGDHIDMQDVDEDGAYVHQRRPSSEDMGTPAWDQGDDGATFMTSPSLWSSPTAVDVSREGGRVSVQLFSAPAAGGQSLTPRARSYDPSQYFDFPKRLISLVAEETVSRETIVAWEHQFWHFAQQDMDEIQTVHREVAFLHWRFLTPLLPCVSHLLPVEVPNRDFEHVDVYRMKRLVMEMRECVRKLAEGASAIVREESKRRLFLTEKERFALLEVAVGQNRPSPQRNDRGASSKKIVSRSLTDVSAVTNPLMRGASIDYAIGNALSLPTTSSHFLSVAAPMNGSSGSLASHFKNAPALKQEDDLLLEEWESRRRRALSGSAHVDDLAPSETRLRMRLEELEQRILFDFLDRMVLQPGALLSSLASTLRRSSFGATGSGGVLGVGGISPLKLHNDSFVATNASHPTLTSTGSSTGLTPMKHQQELNPVDPRGKKRTK